MLTTRRRLRGMSLIELMVGLTVGLIVILALAQFVVSEITSNAALLKATRLNQELRAVMDLVVRDLRRGAYWGNAISGVWYEKTPAILPNPLQSITIDAINVDIGATQGSSVTYSYDVDRNGSLNPATETFTIQQNGTIIELVQAGAEPIQLSDPRNTTVTELTFAATPAPVAVSCVVETGTPPTLTIREITITIKAQLADDPSVTRTLQETVRIRGDSVVGTCPVT